MHCLYCGKSLSFLKKLKHADFCSPAHQQAHYDLQQQLGVQRLMERQRPLRSADPSTAALLGAGVKTSSGGAGVEPEITSFLGLAPVPLMWECRQAMPADPIHLLPRNDLPELCAKPIPMLDNSYRQELAGPVVLGWDRLAPASLELRPVMMIEAAEAHGTHVFMPVPVRPAPARLTPRIAPDVALGRVGLARSRPVQMLPLLSDEVAAPRPLAPGIRGWPHASAGLGGARLLEGCAPAAQRPAAVALAELAHLTGGLRVSLEGLSAGVAPLLKSLVAECFEDLSRIAPAEHFFAFPLRPCVPGIAPAITEPHVFEPERMAVPPRLLHGSFGLGLQQAGSLVYSLSPCAAWISTRLCVPPVGALECLTGPLFAVFRRAHVDRNMSVGTSLLALPLPRTRPAACTQVLAAEPVTASGEVSLIRAVSPDLSAPNDPAGCGLLPALATCPTLFLTTAPAEAVKELPQPATARARMPIPHCCQSAGPWVEQAFLPVRHFVYGFSRSRLRIDTSEPRALASGIRDSTLAPGAALARWKVAPPDSVPMTVAPLRPRSAGSRNAIMREFAGLANVPCPTRCPPCGSPSTAHEAAAIDFAGRSLLPTGGPEPELGNTSASGLLSIGHHLPHPRDAGCEAAGHPAAELFPAAALHPRSRLKPLSVRRRVEPSGQLAGLRARLAWVNQSDGWKFWRYAPADLKWIAIGLPVLLVLWLHPFAKAKTGVEPVADKRSSFENMLTARWENLRQNIAHRAGVALDEDFRSGLGDWEGKGEWAKSWSYDAAGLVRPGQLALYRPSLGLSDYSFEFLGMIEKRGMGWVFRTSDLSNYYAVRLYISKPGPLPALAIERWAVVNGKEKGRRTVPLPITARNEMLCRVRMEVQGTSFRVSLQGQVVDAWSDELLAAGGIGFFTVRGDQARIHSVNITHQNDTLGQLCAFLAPYPLQSSSGSWK